MSTEPSGSSKALTAEGLANFDKFTREKVGDRVTERLIMPFGHTVASLAGVAAGAPTVSELGTSGLCSVFMADAGDVYSCLWIIPPEADVTKQIDFRVLWSSSQSAATGSCTWKILYRAVTAGGAVSLGAPAATTLDSPIALQVDLGEDIPQWTAFGSISANKTGVASLTAGEDMMQVDVESDIHATIADVDLISAEVRYYRRFVG